MKDYIICKPVMLPAQNSQVFDVGQIYVPTHEPNSKYQIRLSPKPNTPTSYRKECILHHLYLVSDEEIKEGDWLLATDTKTIFKASESDINGMILAKSLHLYRTIVATTDKSLGLPLIPQSFIEEYVQKQGKIDVVKVASKSVLIGTKSNGEVNGDPDFINIFEKVIDTYEDRVIILPIKDSWNKEDLGDAFLAGQHSSLSFDEWFDKNY